MTRKRAPLPVEQGNMTSQPFMMDGKPTTMSVTNKTGKDGVPETHVNYKYLNPPRGCSKLRVAGFEVSQRRWNKIFGKKKKKHIHRYVARFDTCFCNIFKGHDERKIKHGNAYVRACRCGKRKP